MKHLFYIIFAVFVLNSSAQETTVVTKVDYSTYLNLGLPSEIDSELIFFKSQSIYSKGKSDISYPESATIEKIGNNKKASNIYYSDYTNKKGYTKKNIDGKTYLASEDMQKITWVIQPKKQKTIMGFVCEQAVGNFRGRKYTVWFTSEIPVPFGPWKLHGLPGLILEAKDNFNQVHFKAIKIEYTHLKDPEKKVEIPIAKYKDISLKDFLVLEEKSLKDKIARIMASKPRGSKINNFKYHKPKGLELKYEWEETKKQ